MGRIDDALRRLAGIAADPPYPLVLDRLVSEGKAARSEEWRKPPPPRPEEHKVAAFAPAGSPPVELRAAPKALDEGPRAHPTDSPARGGAESDGDTDQLIDIRQVVDYAGFVGRSILRHKMLVASVFVLAMALVAAALVVMPKTYYVQVKLLAQRNAVMTALSNPGRAVPWDADAPTRAAAETILRRDNLVSLIAQTDLINQWEARRAPILRLKDGMIAFVLRHEATTNDKLEALVWQLEHRMFVTAGPVGDGTVTIELYWPDGQMAYRLVELAQAKFLEARQLAEEAAISESLHGDVDRTLGQLVRTQASGQAGSRRVTRVISTNARPVEPPPVQAPVTDVLPQIDASLAANPELSRLKGLLASKRLELNRIEEERRRQSSELQSQLAKLLTIYRETYPDVLDTQQKIEALKHDVPRIVNLRNEVDKLETEYDNLSRADAEQLIQAEMARRAAALASAPTAPAPALQPQPEVQVVESVPVESPRQDQAAEFSTLRLRTELNQYQSILERTDSARIELAVSQAAFKYRYTVIKPAQEPKEPSSPNFRLVLVAGFLASLVLAIGIGVAADLMSNRILEAWQIQRQLGLPILGTVRS
jgi:hypothetical protein